MSTLVDGVDLADGIRIEHVFWADPELPDLVISAIDLVRREAEMFPFLGCETNVNHAATQRKFDEFCNRLAGQ